MLTRRFSVALCVSVLSGLSAYGQSSQGNSYVFHVPGAASTDTRLIGYQSLTATLNQVTDRLAPAGTFKILAHPGGNKFYLLGTSSTAALQVLDSGFSSLQVVSGFTTRPNAMALSPDGKILAAGGNELNFIDTNTNGIVGTALLPGALVDVVISRNSKTAYVVCSVGFGTTAVTAFDIATRQRVGAILNLNGGGASGISMNAQGKLYVTAISRIYEIDPTTITIPAGGEIALAGDLGPLKFTPDGTTGYLINKTPSVGGVILKLNTVDRTVSSLVVANPPLLDEIIIAGNAKVFAYSRQTTTLYDVAVNPLALSVSSLSSLFNAQAVLASTISNEVPTGRYLFVVVNQGNYASLIRVDLTNSATVQILVVPDVGPLRFAGFPLQGSPAAFYQLNNFQTLAAGTVSKPFIAQVLDGQDRPVFNVATTWDVPANSGIVVSNATTITDAEGYVSATVTAPSIPGTYDITLTAGTATVPFTITVPGVGCTVNCNPGTPGGFSQITKILGDGQLLEEFRFSSIPLTVKITDTKGKPLSKVPVTFSVTSGPGNVNSGLAETDDAGLAAVYFSSSSIQYAVHSIEPTFITATSQYGSVDFAATTYHVNNDRTGAPTVTTIDGQAFGYFSLTAKAGETTKDAIVLRFATANLPEQNKPIVNVGISLVDPTDFTKPGQASCSGGVALSDDNGVARCNLVAGCTLGLNSMRVSAGYLLFDGVLNVIPGSASKLAILAGDGQTGRAGQTLPIALTASVQTGCGGNAGNVPVTWRVSQGSATLTQTQNVSTSNGSVSTRVTLGQTPGTVKIELAIENGTTVVFSLTNEVVVAGVTLVSGGGQTAFQSAQFANPVVFQIKDANNNPITGAAVAISTINASVSATNPTTNAQGQVSVNVTAGPTAGTASVTATYSGFSTIASFTVRAPGPSVVASSFVNAASEAPGLVACGLGIVKGAGLAPGISGVVSGLNPFGPLPYTLANVTITFNGIPVPLLSVSNINGVQQVNYQTPCELPTGSATAVINVSGSSTTVAGVPVLAAQPGIFTYVGPNNKLYGAVIRASDGSYVTPSSLLIKGEPYYVVVTGLGQTTPPTSTNAAGLPNQIVNTQLVVGVNNAGVPTPRGLYLPGQRGVYLVEFTVPLNAVSGTDQPLAVAALINGQFVFGNPVFLPGVQ